MLAIVKVSMACRRRAASGGTSSRATTRVECERGSRRGDPIASRPCWLNESQRGCAHEESSRCRSPGGARVRARFVASALSAPALTSPQLGKCLDLTGRSALRTTPILDGLDLGRSLAKDVGRASCSSTASAASPASTESGSPRSRPLRSCVPVNAEGRGELVADRVAVCAVQKPREGHPADSWAVGPQRVPAGHEVRAGIAATDSRRGDSGTGPRCSASS